MKIDLAIGKEIVVFTGPECSGKTTSSKRLAQKYQLPRVVEYAREYLTINGLRYDFQDLQKIAEKQVEREQNANKSHSLIICDTDLITLEIWALEVFDRSLELFDDLVSKKHYLLCYPDIPWEPDPMRENPEDRLRLFERYEAYLKNLNATFTILKNADRQDIELVK